MKKRIYFVLLAISLLVALTLLTVSATEEVTVTANGTCGDNLTWELTSDGTLTISGTGAMTNYSSYTSVPWYSNRSAIKTVIIENGVTNIANNAFFSCKNLTDVIISDTVTTIGYQSFYQCTGLTAVTIPAGVSSVVYTAFDGCSKLTNISVSQDNQSYADLDGVLFNKACTSLILFPDGRSGTYTIPDGVTSIAQYAFKNSRLTDITIPTSVVSLGSMAFGYCYGLTSITLPNSITGIGGNAFNSCTNLTNITIPSSVKSIDGYAFYGCSKLTEITFNRVVAPTIGANAFYGVTAVVKHPDTSWWTEDILQNYGGSLTWNAVAVDTVEVASGTCGNNLNWLLTSDGKLTISGTGAMTNSTPGWYKYCTGITDVDIEDGITSIGKAAFSGCYSLTDIILPASVTSIGDSAFSGCTSLVDITFEGMISPTIGANSFSGVVATVRYPDTVSWSEDILQDYGGTLTWESIPIDAFELAGGSCGTNVYWTLMSDGSMTVSGTGAMTDTSDGSCPWDAYRSSIETVIIEEGVTTLRNGSFKSCTNVISVTIPDGLVRIGNNAFRDCSKLTNITIPEGVTHIDDGAFSGCVNLVDITIPVSVVSMGTGVFGGCNQLMVVENGIYYVDRWVVGWDATASDVTIRPGTLGISAYVFARASELTSITLPNSLIGIGRYALEQTGLTNLVIPDSVTTIGEAAFYDCEHLTSVTFGSSLNTIGPWAFGDCIALENVTIPDSAEMIDYGAFYRCTSLTNVDLGNGVVTIGGGALSAGAFAYCSSLTNIKIPASVRSIDGSAFTNCSSLIDITFGGEVPPSIVNNAFDYVTATAYYPDVATWSEDVRLNYGGTLTWEPYQTILSSSVTLDSVLGINFTATDGGNIRVTIDGEEYGVNQEGNLFTVSVFAQDMTKDIVATLYNGEEVVDTKTFNLADYVAAINAGNYSTEEKALANATLTYCQYAAKAKYGDDYTGSLSELEVITENLAESYPFATGDAPAGTSVHCYLEEACQLRLRLPGTYTVTVDGEEVTGTDNVYATGTILPQDYDETHTFVIKDGDTVVFSGSYSVLSYIGACLERELGTADMQNLLIAMYHYYAAANTYTA